MTNENWIGAAMSDDALVVEILLRLRHSEPPVKSGGVSAPTLDWRVRQRRSKAGKKGDQARASPTTPLSWSCATSFSGGVEESSGAIKPPETVRSKISRMIKTTPFKRSRRKKTLTELKEEESLLLKERNSLRNELESVQALLEQQRARNNALKKLKAESQASVPCKVAATMMMMTPASSSHHISSSKREESDSDMRKGSSFSLPDLNIPLDNDPSLEVLCGTAC
ncbi:PREDICTED: uncharacterized protein LOC104813579 [Tarenaya hassleriana]|uniref:uncharacterized protein LOC104813579 n=1 Tax=Tarenaya hassleriana TaxID=28532 RepID=UPI00053C620B|nr:PREDICTED: uncharacterized protein LOC104813579 [Tarenaya hassleriana]